MTEKEKIEKIKDLRPIDDIFFEVLALNTAVCQEILQTILEDDKLVVTDVITQADERNLYGRSVRLDALCILGNGSKVNIEIQRSDNDNHLKRARFNASSITVKDSNPGTKFDQILELYIVYISEFDFLKGNKTIYHVDKILRETGDVIDDGLHEIFVNTVINDGTDISELMSCFTQRKVTNAKFPALSSEIRRLKETKGGIETMAAASKYFEEMAVKEERKEKICNMLRENCSKNLILSVGYTEEEYSEAEILFLNKDNNKN